jgi:hypothetical protein
MAWLHAQSNAINLAVLTPTTEDSDYPVSNATILPITKAWRTTSVASPQELLINFGGFDASFGKRLAPLEHPSRVVGGVSQYRMRPVDYYAAQSVDIIALVNHNISEDAAIGVAAGTTSACSDFSQSMTWRELLAFLYLSTPLVYQFWKITIDDPTNADGYIKVGYVMIGRLTIPDFIFRQGWTSSPVMSNQQANSQYAVSYAAAKSRYQLIALPFGPLRSDDIATLETLHSTAQGSALPILFIPDTVGSDAYFGRIQNMLSTKTHTAQYQYTTINLREDGYGRQR